MPRELAKEIEEVASFIVDNLNITDLKTAKALLFFTFVKGRGYKAVKLRELTPDELFYLQLAGYKKRLILEVRYDSWSKLRKEEKLKLILKQLLRIKIEDGEDKKYLKILPETKVDGSFDYYWQMLKNDVKYFVEEKKVKGNVLMLKRGAYFQVYLNRKFRDEIAKTVAKFNDKMTGWTYSDRYIVLFFDDEEKAKECKEFFSKIIRRRRNESVRRQQGEEPAEKIEESAG